MPHVLLYCLLIISFCSLSNELENTYQPDPNFISYTTESGLSNNIVTAITQDSDGFMWFGTQDGLNRFNGNNFKVYRYSPNKKYSLAGVRVTSLHVDSKKQLWVGTETGGLSLHQPDTDDFLNFRHNTLDLNTISSNAITSLESDNKHLWIGTLSGISKLNLSTLKIERVAHSQQNGSGTNHAKISSLTKDNNNNIWIGTLGGGLNKYSNDKDFYTYFQHQADTPHSLSSNQVSSVYVDSYNEVWVGTEQKGLNKYQKNCQCFKTYLAKTDDPTTLPHNMALSFTENEKRELWIGTIRGSAIYHRATDTFTRYKLIRANKAGRLYRSNRSSYTSADGTVWFGSQQMGVISIPNDGFRFQSYQYAANNVSLKSDDINSLLVENNKMWTGSISGLFRYKLGENGQLSFLDRVHQAFALKIIKSSDNTYWLGTNQGLVHLDKQLKELSHFTKNDFSSHYIRENAVLDVIQARNGDIFMASWEGGFSRLIDEKTAEFDNIGQLNDPRGELQSLSIYALKEDKQGNIWIGSRAGIDKYNQHLNSITNYTLLDDEYINATVYYIFEGESGLWLGTNFGLYRYSTTEDKFTAFPLTLDSQYIQAIAEESDEVLWLTTFNGLYRVNLINNETTKFTKKDGVQGNEFNTKGIFKAPDGWLYFSGTEGVTKVNTQQFTSSNFAPTINFVTLHLLESDKKQRIIGESALNLSADENSFSITLIVDDYRSPAKLKYRYKLNHGKWNELDNTQTIQFLNQEYGLLKLEVQSTNHLGIWQPNTQLLTVNVHPPIWQTNIAYTLYFLIIISLIFTAYSIRVKRSKVAQKELENKIAERTAEVNNLLIQKQNLFANISHELRTPLTLITAPLEQLITDNTFNTKQNKLLKMANNNSKRLFSLVEKILHLTSIDKQDKAQENIAIDELLHKYIIAFEPLLQAKNIKLSKNVHSNATIYADNHELSSVIENLFSNALKYTMSNGWVKLHSRIKGCQYQLVIENAHQGLTTLETEKVFERFERLGQPDSEQGFGLGLAFVREICQQNSWKIECISIASHSVSFMLTINDYGIVQPQKISTPQNEISLLAANKKPRTVPGKQNILIVEDNNELREFLAEIFSTHYQVITAKNGLLGVEIAIAEIPDIIISDVMMPELDGYQLVQQLAQHDNTCHIPVILLTAKADKESELKGLELGSIDYIAKPFDTKELLLKVQNTLTKRTSLLNLSNSTSQSHETQYISERDTHFNTKLNNIVEKNYSNSDFSVEQLVDQIAMSERQLQRKMKALFDQTPAEFIRNYRLQASKALLLAGKSISNTADLVGFNSSSYFSRSFKTAFKKSPSDFIQPK